MLRALRKTMDRICSAVPLLAQTIDQPFIKSYKLNACFAFHKMFVILTNPVCFCDARHLNWGWFLLDGLPRVNAFSGRYRKRETASPEVRDWIVGSMSEHSQMDRQTAPKRKKERKERERERKQIKKTEIRTLCARVYASSPAPASHSWFAHSQQLPKVWTITFIVLPLTNSLSTVNQMNVTSDEDKLSSIIQCKTRQRGRITLFVPTLNWYLKVAVNARGI